MPRATGASSVSRGPGSKKTTGGDLFREMRDDEGGIHSSEDADSEGVEGKYYVWTPGEVIEVLGKERGQLFCDAYDITPHGNFEGKSIPRLKQSIVQFAESRSLEVASFSK